MSSRALSLLTLLALLLSACGGAPPAAVPSAPANGSPSIAPAASAAPAASPSVTPPSTPAPAPRPIAAVLGDVDLGRLQAHVAALAAVESRDPRHPGHARAIAYLKEQLGKLAGVRVDSQRFLYQNLVLENVFATIDPPGGAPPSGWLLVLAHFDATAKATPGWRPAVDPAPGADDNGTGTASLLEYARILSADRSSLRQRVVLAFVDGEEFFFKGSAAYLETLPKPNPYANALNVDMVGFNPVADRLDLVWYTQASKVLRDRVIAANERYAIGVAPLVEELATDPNVTIMDIAPWGIAGVPSVALAERYPAAADASYPGNTTFHTVNDTPDKITNTRLWLKATRLLLATALELVRD